MNASPTEGEPSTPPVCATVLASWLGGMNAHSSSPGLLPLTLPETRIAWIMPSSAPK